MNKTYYQKLGLKESASAEKIKTAYKILAIKFHHEKNESDEQCKIDFQEINAIYEILIDPISKREYDTALKIKRERIKQSDLKRKHSLRKRRYERNYFRRYEPTTNDFSSQDFLKNLYRNLGPVASFFLLLFLAGVIYNGFEKLADNSENSANSSSKKIKETSNQSAIVFESSR